MILDEKGNTTLLGCAALFIVTGIFFVAITNAHKSYLNLGLEMKSLLCLKKKVKTTSLYINRMEKINTAIQASFTLEVVSLAIPGLAPLKAGGAKFRRMMKILQNTLFVAEMKNKAIYAKKGCPLSKNIINDAYKHKLLKLERDYQGRTILREKKWQETYYSKQSAYTLYYSVINGDLKFTSQRVKLR